jgi:hypothetical protein
MNAMNAIAGSPRRSAWREPMLWLVAGLPFASIVAGLVLVFVIARGGNVDPLSAGVRRTAQVQAEDTRADEEALRRGLHANLQREADGVVLDVQGETGDAATLRLRLLHPTTAAQDREFTLQRIAPRRWRSGGVPASTHAWHVRVEPGDGRWRLAGRLDAAADGADLEPLWRR